MIKIKQIRKEEEFTPELTREEFVNFMFKYIGNHGDPKELIDKSLDYIFSKDKSKGGLILTAIKDNILIGGSIVLNTGMKGYIPENLLVYGAVHKDFRKNGVIRMLLEKHFELSSGDFKMHVDFSNPAVTYFEKIGFNKQYIDMRYER